MTSFLKFLGRCTFFLLLFCSCNNGEERKVQRSFYYWKTVFNLTAKEQQTLKELNVQKLYVKFFDVDWNEESHAAQPVAKSIFSQKPPYGIAIIPVVFITQEPFQYLDKAGIDSLAKNTAALLASIAANDSLQLSNEVQLDCDWTQTTRNKYFYLLNKLKEQPFFQKKIISATIRLHQVKFVSQVGIPPVNKGLLMCYNMGNLRHPQTKNSIIDESELKKYINNLQDYNLPLDVALPLFDWWVLFDGAQYKGLVRDFNPADAWKDKRQVKFERDTVINGTAFKAGQWLRHEGSDAAIVKKCAELVSAKLKQKELTVILYHLHETNLTKYSAHEMENFYNSFH